MMAQSRDSYSVLLSLSIWSAGHVIRGGRFLLQRILDCICCLKESFHKYKLSDALKVTFSSGLIIWSPLMEKLISYMPLALSCTLMPAVWRLDDVFVQCVCVTLIGRWTTLQQKICILILVTKR